MAGARKQYELLFQLKATYGNNFQQTFTSAAKAMKDMQGSISKINSLQKDVSGYKKQQEALDKNKTKLQQLQEEHSRLQTEISETEQPTEKMRKALERNEKQIEQTDGRKSPKRGKYNALHGENNRQRIECAKGTGNKLPGGSPGKTE